MKLSRKSQIWVSVVIYTLVAVLGLILVLNTGIPLLTEMKDRSVVSKVQDVMLTLDQHITDIAAQGEGSQATVSFEVRDGQVKFEDGTLVWEVETKSKIISPRTSTSQGNLIISSNANVKTYEYDDYYKLETSIKGDTFQARINKYGTENNWEDYNTSSLIGYVSHNGDRMDGVFTFTLNNEQSSSEGNGYTELVPTGNNTNLGRAKVIAHMNSSFANYDLEFTLESYADFLTVNIKNFEPKG
jgi:hypothetical protein